MEPVSVVIITFNEAENIGRCIDAAAKVAAEVVVLDSHSTDATEIIARQKGAHFFQHKFEGHIQQKNIALSFAKYEWVLSLDADEVLSEEAIQKIQQLKDWNKYDAFSFNRLNNYCGQWIKYGGWYPDKKTRLVKKSAGQWGGTNPHDKFELNNPLSVKHIDADILHYSYRTQAEHITQSQKFSAIAANALFTLGKQSALLKIVIGPPVKFIRDYIFRLGFLDGKNGFNIAYISAKAVYWKYSMLQQLSRTKV
jgi:glycosyltransferase involved in cell wall biosynthesis